jgi:regulator of RNase E activity RraA
MKTIVQVSSDVLEFLQHTDTCTVSNAIEAFSLRMRNDGFVHGVTKCLFPALPPVAGYAITGRFRTSAPPIANLCYYNRMDFWKYVASLPAPKILVMEDADSIPGTGALFGEIHARIAKALGCVAYVTNGTVRDLAGLKELGFQCFAGGASVSHAYAHVIDFGEPVQMGGFKISPGDLLQGDCHGVQAIPTEIADRLPETAAKIRACESELFKFCASPDFSLKRLGDLLKQEGSAREPGSPY